MKWVKIDGAREQPVKGTYPDWKPQIAKDCKYRCVYCAILEADFGGIVNFHVDHFRPKSIKEFEHLENIIGNLFYSCGICNRFKSDIWPGEPDVEGAIATFLDPSAVDYNQHMGVREADHFAEGVTVAGKFIVERLYLNRPQLVLSRRASTAAVRLGAYVDYFLETKSEFEKIDSPESKEVASELNDCILTTLKLQTRLTVARPYEAGDTKRPHPLKKP